MPTEEIFTIILLAAASLLCISLIFYFYRVTKSIAKLETHINDLSAQLKPLIASTTSLSEKLNTVAEEAKGQIDSVKGIISDVKDRVDTILALEEKVRRNIEEPVNGFIKQFSAVINGVNTFWNAYKNKH
jgi:uncharacterized protein YoxC